MNIPKYVNGYTYAGAYLNKIKKNQCQYAHNKTNDYLVKNDDLWKLFKET